MRVWVNLIGYQIVWFVTVIGASHGLSWPAWAAATALWIGHFIPSSHRTLDLKLLVFAALSGVCLDGVLAASGVVRFSPAAPAVPGMSSPMWILGLWLAFSTTLTRSLGWLRGRPVATWLLGATGGPLAYWGAARGWGVIVFEHPQWFGILALSVGWSIALTFLIRIAGDTPTGSSHFLAPDEEADFP